MADYQLDYMGKEVNALLKWVDEHIDEFAELVARKITVSSSGNGNVVTGATATGHEITLEKTIKALTKDNANSSTDGAYVTGSLSLTTSVQNINLGFKPSVVFFFGAGTNSGNFGSITSNTVQSIGNYSTNMQSCYTNSPSTSYTALTSTGFCIRGVSNSGAVANTNGQIPYYSTKTIWYIAFR